MNIAENLTLLANTKESIRLAINRKGVTLESSAPFSAYSAAIMAIETASLYGEVEASVASPAFYVTGVPEPPATSSNYMDGYVIAVGRTEGFEPYSGNNTNNDVLVCDMFRFNNQGVYLSENSEYYSGGGIALNAAYITELNNNHRLPIDVLSGGTYYVGVWKFHQTTNGSDYVLDEQLPVTISAATPTPQYDYALSCDGIRFGNADLTGTFDSSTEDWTKTYVNLYYGTGDWNIAFTPSGTVDPTEFRIENDADAFGISSSDYNIGYDDEQEQWYVQANDNTVNYSDQSKFFGVKAVLDSNDEDVTNGTLHVDIGTVDARPEPDEPSGEIPEGLWGFDVEQEGGTNVMWVEAFMDNDMSSTPQETVVNIYEDPNDSPVNTITYSYISKFSEGYVNQTDSSAGLYAVQYVAFDTGNSPIILGLSCNTAGYYYIEVVNHTNPRFYDDTVTQIYPDNAQ